MNEQNGKSVGVLVADDAAVIRKAVLSFLESVPNIKVLGVAENFAQTLEMAGALKPDVVVLDLHMPDGHAFAPALVKSKLQLCGSQVLAISFSSGENDDGEARTLAERFGAVAYLDKARFSDELIPAILRFGFSATAPV